MGKKAEELFVEGGDWKWKALRGAFESWLDKDWEHTNGMDIELVVKESDNVVAVSFKAFESWLDGVVDDDWWELKEEYGSDEPRECFYNYWDNNPEFRQGVKNHVKEYQYGSKEQKEEREEEDGGVENLEFGGVQELGLLNDRMVVQWGKVKGTILKFAKDVEEIKGTEEDFNIENVLEAWNRWMMNKFGNDWVQFSARKLDSEDLHQAAESLYEDNKEFRMLVETKYEYDPEELEGNSDRDEDGDDDTVSFGGQEFDKADNIEKPDKGDKGNGSKSKHGLSRFEDHESEGSEKGSEEANRGGNGNRQAGRGRDSIRYSKWVGEACKRESELRTGEIYNENVWCALDRIPSRSIDTIVTSPPYWDLRDYDGQVYQPMAGDISCDHVIHNGKCYKCDAWAGQLGHEPTKEMFIRDLVAILEKAKVVLKDTGHLYLNIGDTYTDKSAQMVPERVYAELVDQGWKLRDKIVWAKKVWLDDDDLVGNGKPSPHDSRLAPQWEPMYHFTKKGDYWHDIDSNRLKPPSFEGDMGEATDDSKFRRGEDSRRGRQYNPLGTNPPDVWQINSDGYRGEHTAVFPVELPKRSIEISTPEKVCSNCGRPYEKRNIVGNDDTVTVGGDRVEWDEGCSCGVADEPGVVLDIFLGSGTTAVAASDSGYRWTGIEVSEKYVEEARSRITTGVQRKIGEM